MGEAGGFVRPYNLAGTSLGAGFQPFGAISDTIDGLAFAPSTGTIFLAGDSNLTTDLSASFDNPQLFINILQGGNTVVVQSQRIPSAGTNLVGMYDALAGVDAISISAPTASALDGADLFVGILPTTAYSAGEVTAMQDLLLRAGSIVFIGEHFGGDNFTPNNAIISAAIADLGSSLDFVPLTIFDDGFHTATGSQIADDPFTDLVSSVRYAATSEIAGGTPLLFTTTGEPFLAYETFGTTPPVTPVTLSCIFGETFTSPDRIRFEGVAVDVEEKGILKVELINAFNMELLCNGGTNCDFGPGPSGVLSVDVTIQQDDTGIPEVRGTARVTNVDDSCTFGLHSVGAGRREDVLVIDDEAGGTLLKITGDAGIGGPIFASSTRITSETCGPLPPGHEPFAIDDASNCGAMKIRSPFTSVGGDDPEWVITAAGLFEGRVRTDYCQNALGGPGDGTLATDMWVNATLEIGPIADFVDPRRIKGGKKDFSDVLVACAIDTGVDCTDTPDCTLLPLPQGCTDADGDGFASCSSGDVLDCDDSDGDIYPNAPETCNGLDNDCDGSILGTPPEIRVTATKHTVGLGTGPGVTKDPLADILVCAYDKSAGSCAQDICGGISHRQYTCIAGDTTVEPPLSPSCPSVDCCTTNGVGQCSIFPEPGDYIVISADAKKTVLPDPLGVSASNLACGQVMRKNLLQIEKVNTGSSTVTKLPGKSMRQTGSELLIIEPEFIVWDGSTQLYPFIFESVGAWDVTAGLAPPEGFVSDYDSLSITTVDSDLTTGISESVAAQFSVTEVGSDLVPTQTTFEVNHNGVSEMIPSKVDIRLTAEYAKKMKHNVKALEKAGLIYKVKAKEKVKGGGPGGCTATDDPEVMCNDGVDNDCDGNTDSEDTDCPGGSCTDAPLGASCSVDSDCCSNKCKGRSGNKVCK